LERVQAWCAPVRALLTGKAEKGETILWDGGGEKNRTKKPISSTNLRGRREEIRDPLNATAEQNSEGPMGKRKKGGGEAKKMSCNKGGKPTEGVNP